LGQLLKTDMQNDNLTPQQQNTPTPEGQEPANIQPPSVASVGERVIQPLSSDLTPEATPATQPVVTSVSASPSSTVASIYSTASADAAPANDNDSPYPTMNLTGSQIAQEKKPLHWGIYVIAAYNIIGFALSFFSSSQSGTFYIIVMLIDLLVGIGLLFRLELARKVMVWLAGILFVLSAISLILLVGLQQRIAQSKTNYNNAISHINQQQLTPEQQKQLATTQTTISNQQKQAGKAVGLTYFTEGASFVEGLAVMIYLTRPKIKDVFVPLST